MKTTMSRVILCACFLLVASVSSANPFTCDDTANTCSYLITAQEPTKTSGGAALTNYKQTNLKTQLNGGSWQIIVKPATAPTGGGTVSQTIIFATTACAVTTLNVKASGTNTNNVEGVETVATGSPVTRDRTTDPTCAPAAVNSTVN